jgi:hypothetical protein
LNFQLATGSGLFIGLSSIRSVGLSTEYDNKSCKISETVKESEEGDMQQLPISWPAFCNYWATNLPKIVIQWPSEDICDDCVVFANKHKRIKRRRRGLDDEDTSDDEVVLIDETVQEGIWDEEEDHVLAAGHHAMTARKQTREFFNSKNIEAREHASCKQPHHQRTFTFVANFAQNMYVPNFAAEQPGATYYFSPLNIYPFGVLVDTSTDPTLLTAFVFTEGKKLI